MLFRLAHWHNQEKTMSRCKRAIVAGVLIAFGPALVQVCSAQGYPAKPIRIIVPFPPGAPEDFVTRVMSERLQANLRQSLIIENKPGAGGNIGAEIVAKAPPDGYTLMASIDTVVTINPHVYKKLSFKPEADFVPVVYLANTAQTLVCHPSVPARTLAEFVAHAKASNLNYASGGQGVPGHMAMELFLAASGLRMTHIPYKGPGPATQDVLAGQVPCGFLATPVVIPHVKSGKLTGLAVSQTRRSPIAPELPTVAEAGFAGFDAGFGLLLQAPRGTPEAIVRTLAEEVAKVLALPEVRERMLAADLEYVPGTPASAAARVASDAAKWRTVVERIKLQVD